MIWLVAILSSVYSMALIALGIYLGYRLKSSVTESFTAPTVKDSKPLLEKSQPTSGALKSLTPLERSLEDSKEIKERIEHLLS